MFFLPPLFPNAELSYLALFYATKAYDPAISHRFLRWFTADLRLSINTVKHRGFIVGEADSSLPRPAGFLLLEQTGLSSAKPTALCSDRQDFFS